MSGNQHQETKSQLDTIESAIEAVRNQILILVRIPDLNESNLEKVPGNKILAPNISPAMVSITMANISIAP